jgi:hypothetical protein
VNFFIGLSINSIRKRKMTMRKTIQAFEEAWAELDEAVRVKYERSKKTGRVEKKFFTPRQGYRIKYKEGKPIEVYMSPIERRHRSEAARKAALKRKKKVGKKKIPMSKRVGKTIKK